MRPPRGPRGPRWRRRLGGLVAVGLVTLTAPDEARAIPAFARIYDKPCGACHTVFPHSGVRTDGTANVQEISDLSAFSQGNGTDPSCGVLDDCADVAAELLPKLKSSTCLTSRNTESGLPWGVCAND